MTQRSMSGAEVVKGNAAADSPQGSDGIRRIFYVTNGRGLCDFNNQATGDLGAVVQKRDERAQPLLIAKCQPGNVKSEPDLRVDGKFTNCFFKNIVVDQTDQPEIFEIPYEFDTTNNCPLLVAHPQKAFVIIDLPRCGTDHGLKSKKKTIPAQRRPQSRLQRQAVTFPQ